MTVDESIPQKPEESCKYVKEKKDKDPSSSITTAEKDEKKVSYESSSEKEPIPSTSAASKNEDGQEGKKYRKSLVYLQFQWCKKQPDYLKLRQELMDKYE